MCDREACNEGAYSNLLEQAEAAIQRVRDLHVKSVGPYDDYACQHCYIDEDRYFEYPCPTIRALDGEQE